MFDCCDGVVAFGKARQEGGVGFVALVDVVDFFVLVGFADDWGVAVGGGNGFDDFFQAGFVPAFFFCFGKAVGCVGGLGGDVQGVGCAAPAYFGYFIAAFIDNACFDVAQRDGYLGRLRGQGERAVVVDRLTVSSSASKPLLSVRLMEMMRDRASVLNGLPLMVSLATGVRWLPPVSVMALKILTAWSLMVVRMVMAFCFSV